MANDLIKRMNEDGDLFYDTDSVEEFVADAESVGAENKRLSKEVEDWTGMYRIAASRAEAAEASEAKLLEALVRAERKLSAYVGICKGDKELTETVLPMARAAIQSAEARKK